MKTLYKRLMVSALAAAALSPAFATNYQFRQVAVGIVPAAAPQSGFSVSGSQPASQAFNSATVGSYAAPDISFSLINSGTAPATLALPAMGGANAADFSAATTCSSIAPSGVCSVTVRFLPSQVGAESATLLLAGTPYVFSGSGTAVARTYATWNPADKSSYASLTNGNLTISMPGNSVSKVRSTLGKSSGKWYWEVVQGGTNTNGPITGVATAGSSLTMWTGGDTASWAYYGTGNKYNGAGPQAYGASFGYNKVIGVMLDMDAKTISFIMNNVNQGVAFNNLSGTVFAAGGDSGGVASYTLTANFGASPFTYTVPAGYNAGLY